MQSCFVFAISLYICGGTWLCLSRFFGDCIFKFLGLIFLCLDLDLCYQCYVCSFPLVDSHNYAFSLVIARVCMVCASTWGFVIALSQEVLVI